LIDEWAGRTTATRLQIEVLGTAGVLVLAALINRVLTEEGFPLQ
jgi:predicted nucleic acid-binding protein